ncbi:MAG: iron-containing alcohol dehydrogenase [Rubrobacter sp.]|jgi:alcohol dehydrogenase class IV|nr:iron-containing alcohol dehydrogenase [Rubrobacter sp.]
MEKGTHEALHTERVHFGAGSLEKVCEEVESKERAFVVTGRTLHEKTDLVKKVEAMLGEKHAGTFAGMSEHTPGSAVEEAARLAEGCDLLVSFGGGSVIDGAKAVARKVGYPMQIAVPTTLSAAEWAERVGVTDEAAGKKAGFVDRESVPHVVVLDPETTVHTPERLWLSTGIRALDHAVEGFLYGGPHPIPDIMGLEGASRLFEFLPLSKENPGDLEVRHELQFAAWLSYFAPLNTPMGISHNLGRRLGASYGIPHGITSCITLGPSLEVMGDGIAFDRWAMLVEALDGEPSERVARLVEELGLPNKLSDFDVPEGELEKISSEFGENRNSALSILRLAYR